MDRISLWWLRGLLLGMIWAAYYPIWKNDFVDFDDEVFITGNVHVREGLTPDGIDWAVFNAESPYRAPMTWLTLQLDTELSALIAPNSERPRPEVVHAQNLVWHSVNVLLLFGLCFRLPGGTRGRAFLVAALFAVHPMHVESVAWAIERKDVLMCAFGLVSVRAYLRFAETRRWFYYAASVVALAASLGSKPMLLTMPFLLLLLDFWPLRRTRFSPASAMVPGQEPARVTLKRLVLEKAPYFLLVWLVALSTLDTRSGIALGSITVTQRLMNALSGYGWYVSTTFWPASLAALYPHPLGDWSWEMSLVGVWLLGSVTVLALRNAHPRPWLLVGWLWFVGTLFPLIGFAQGGAQAWADRFSYWPHIGLFIALVWGAAEIGARLRIPPAVSWLVWTGILIGFMVWTSIQVGYWRDSITLWERTVAATERNAYAHDRLALGYRRQGRNAEADFHLYEAARIARARHLH